MVKFTTIICVLLCLPMHAHFTYGLRGPESGRSHPQIARKTGDLISKKEFQVEERVYLASLNLGRSHLDFIVSEMTAGKRHLLFHFWPAEYSPVSQAEDLTVATIEGEIIGAGWRYCRSHFCDTQNGAVLYNVRENKSFRLEYSEETGVTLSHELSCPRNKGIKDWLIKWWEGGSGSLRGRPKYKIRFR